MTRHIMVTGHRKFDADRVRIENQMRIYLQDKKTEYPELVAITGMAFGADLLFARSAFAVRVPFIAAVPFAYQCGWRPKEIHPNEDLGLPDVSRWQENYETSPGKIHWPWHSASEYFRMLQQASQVVYVDEEEGYKLRGVATKIYHPAKMRMRNNWMIAHADEALAIYDGRGKGGTFNALSTLQKEGKTYTVINPVRRPLRGPGGF